MHVGPQVVSAVSSSQASSQCSDCKVRCLPHAHLIRIKREVLLRGPSTFCQSCPVAQACSVSEVLLRGPHTFCGVLLHGPSSLRQVLWSGPHTFCGVLLHGPSTLCQVPSIVTRYKNQSISMSWIYPLLVSSKDCPRQEPLLVFSKTLYRLTTAKPPQGSSNFYPRQHPLLVSSKDYPTRNPHMVSPSAFPIGIIPVRSSP